MAIQEHSVIHEEPLKHHSLGDNWLLITSSATWNTRNAAIGGVGILLNTHAKLALERSLLDFVSYMSKLCLLR